MEQIIMHPIGIIRSPYQESRHIPIQGTFDDRVEAWLELKDEYVKGLKANRVYFTEVDVLNGTPLLDIKPYVKYFDSRDNVISGWLKKHFKDGKIPDEIVIQ